MVIRVSPERPYDFGGTLTTKKHYELMVLSDQSTDVHIFYRFSVLRNQSGTIGFTTRSTMFRFDASHRRDVDSYLDIPISDSISVLPHSDRIRVPANGRLNIDIRFRNKSPEHMVVPFTCRITVHKRYFSSHDERLNSIMDPFAIPIPDDTLLGSIDLDADSIRTDEMNADALMDIYSKGL